jgi:hypothetical protein
MRRYSVLSFPPSVKQKLGASLRISLTDNRQSTAINKSDPQHRGEIINKLAFFPLKTDI